MSRPVREKSTTVESRLERRLRSDMAVVDDDDEYMAAAAVVDYDNDGDDDEAGQTELKTTTTTIAVTLKRKVRYMKFFSPR